MKKHGFFTCVIFICILFFFGCSSTFITNKFWKDERTAQFEIDQTKAVADSLYKYEAEEALLERIIHYHAQAQSAYEDFDFGLAETNIDSAFILISDLNINSIDDEDLVWRFKSAVFSLGKELGIILNESERISKEDYTAWIDELENIEDFKSGRWSDEELRKIVVRISLKSDMPLDFNEQVKKAIYFFQTKRRAEVTKWLERSGRYLPIIREILTEEELPHDIAYLSMIESGFNPNAYSRARAVGLWQFIYSTGRLYGLKRDQWIDERRDPVKSTMAAANHLKDLYNLYNDWNLVMAAYNCGAARVTRQFNHKPDIEFWDMTLPRETRSYVPFFMAALIIAKEPELFGFENIKYEEPFEFDTYDVHPYTSLAKAAQCAGVSLDELKNLNYELRKNRTPAGKEKYPLKIPRGSSERFAVEYAKVEIEKYAPPKITTYYVKRGDTLSEISRRFGVSITGLLKANNLKNKHRLRIGQRLTIPNGKRKYTASASSNSSKSKSISKKDAILYTVEKNDNLGLIAEKFNTTVSVLQKLNNMGRRTRIYVGQKLYAPPKKQAKTITGKTETARFDTSPDQITYIIQAGDSLYEIAKNYGVDYKDIKRWNKIKDHRKIQPGQKIIIKKTKG